MMSFRTAWQTDKLALLPLVKRRVFSVKDRLKSNLKMDKHKACKNNSVVTLKSVGSNDHERTDEAIFQDESNGVPGRKEQPKQVSGIYYRNQCSNSADLQKKSWKGG